MHRNVSTRTERCVAAGASRARARVPKGKQRAKQAPPAKQSSGPPGLSAAVKQERAERASSAAKRAKFLDRKHEQFADANATERRSQEMPAGSYVPALLEAIRAQREGASGESRGRGRGAKGAALRGVVELNRRYLHAAVEAEYYEEWNTCRRRLGQTPGGLQVRCRIMAALFVRAG